MQERYDLFVHDGEVWQQSGDEHRPEEEVYTGPWPVRVEVLRRDLHDGRAASIALLEEFGQIVEQYPVKDQHHHSGIDLNHTGAYTTYAVILDVASAKDYLALDKLITFAVTRPSLLEWDCWTDERPE